MNNGNHNLIGEKENSVVFDNKYEDTPITGVLLNHLPFIVLISVAIVGFSALIIIKRKRIAER